jgi:hypothetical protein
MTQHQDLKPCPFCGSDAQFDYEPGDERTPQRWRCGCRVCSIWTPFAHGSSTWAVDRKQDRAAKSKTLAAWNLRAATALEAARREPLTDTERIQFLEDLTMIGWAPQLLYDDNGNWIVSTSGVLPVEPGGMVSALHDLEDAVWMTTVRGAIDDAKRRLWPDVGAAIEAAHGITKEAGNAG